MLHDLSTFQIGLVALLFVWSGFVRSGLGFGGAALGLPLLLLINDEPLLWLPIIGLHLLFFSTLTLRTRLHNVDWGFLRRSSPYVVPAAVVGVFGLIKLPTLWLLLFIYSVTLFYSVLWLMNWTIHSHRAWVDKLLLVLGGYITGTSLSGAPVMIAVFMRNVALPQLRNTLFVLWFILVTIKMATFIVFDVPLHMAAALILLPVAAIGHFLGLKTHDYILKNHGAFTRWIGAGLMVVSVMGLWKIL